MASISKQKQKRNKKYYMQSAKKHKTGSLQVGVMGILLSCNNTEKQCVREAYNILNEYADKLYGPELEFMEDGASSQNDIDLEDQLAKEISVLKSRKHMRRFQQVDTKVKNVLFIQTNVPDPTMLVESIFKDLKNSCQKKTRYILKMVPVACTCKPFPEDFKKSVYTWIEEYSKKENSNKCSYKVMCKIRNNNSVDNGNLIQYGREAVEKFLPTWTPSLVHPEVVVSIDVLQSVCCLGILKNYIEYKKYNLAELVPVEETKSFSQETILVEQKSQSTEKSIELEKTASSDSETSILEKESQEEVAPNEIQQQKNFPDEQLNNQCSLDQCKPEQDTENELEDINLFSSSK